MNKKTLRLKYKQLRKQLREEEIEELSLQIANQLLTLPIWDKTYYHLFLSIVEQKEINTEYVLQILAGKDKEIVVSSLTISQFNFERHFHNKIKHKVSLFPTL